MPNSQTDSKPTKYRSFGRYQRYIEPIARDPLVRGYFEIVATLFLISFFLLFAIRPTLNTVFGLRRKISDLTDVDTRLDMKIQALISAQSTYAKFQPQLPMLDRALPPTPNVDTMISDIENIVSESGTTMNSLSVDHTGLTADAWVLNPGFVAGKRAPLGFSLNVSGDFSSGQKLIKNLTAAPRIVSVSDVTFIKGGQETGTLTISITGVGYFLP